MRVRFAPSPTGHLHVGNVRTALFNWLLARGHEGTFILRIEDTDAERSTADSDAMILEDLRWLGLDWDEGPEVGGPVGPYRSSERLGKYQSRARVLIEQGHAYYCFCTPEQLDAERTEALANNLPPKYSGRCAQLDPEESRRRVQSGEHAAVRFRTPANSEIVFTDLVRGDIRFHTDVIGDQVLLRSDGHPAYNFAVVVDDGLMGVTHVVRGEDHISNTPRQILIYEALGFEPPAFGHVAMVLGPDHTKLSKRHGSVSVDEFRAKGYLPEALLNYLALLSWSPGENQEVVPIAEMAKRFALSDVGHSASVFDEEKLAWVNRHYLKDANPDRLARLSMPYLERAGYVTGRVKPDGFAYLVSVVPLFNTSVDRLEQVPLRVRQLFKFSAAGALEDAAIRGEVAQGPAREVIAALAAELQSSPRLVDKAAFRGVADRVKQKTGQKGRALFHPIRIALTGAADGPELDLLVPAMEKGAELPESTGIARVVGARERVQQFAHALDQ
ncbi:MAG TPA: glutamate--tRNA ligase [Vicinamibacterales bacterium]|nr:glutamate--tRNA ligase [Vicinamibacterales bacterium]